MVRMNSRRTIGPKRIERSREIYKAIAADAAACGMTPKHLRNSSWSRPSWNCESSAGYLGELRGSGASSNRVYGGSPPMRQGAHITRTMSLQATPAWWVERVLPMAAVATRISTFGHGLPLLPTLAEHQCVGSSVPWRPGKTGDSAVERLFSGKKLGLDLQAWINR